MSLMPFATPEDEREWPNRIIGKFSPKLIPRHNSLRSNVRRDPRGSGKLSVYTQCLHESILNNFVDSEEQQSK